MWNPKDGFSNEQKRENARTIKAELEALRAVIPGIISLEVLIDTLPTGDCDIVLNSLFASEEALAAYQVHPEHVRVSQYVSTVLQNRTCADYLER
jgi:heme-degrading monooxygenase HmoA